ncbi:ferredoxin-type protein NapF [Thiolapillus brandeum]|uniref:Ferredoxin-type protein NapF n=1 Tax=Thiolapillus brandeum TaxID=1076588 RepID=A0A7U6GJP9_9GAMM|nr:ferredoxin-type protein NapF [Thiolapillus brandeum]BAO44834.1 ferredoxin-type protein NapF [Thiolapillus brandeum]
MFEAHDAKTNLNRRQLLRGKIRKQQPPMRPPWARDEDQFVKICSRCDDCIDACEDQLLFRGSGGFPEISFQSAGCDFCGDCLTACTIGALQAPVPAPSLAWPHRASIKPDCLSLNGIVCRSCGDACDTDAIRFRLETGGRATPLLDQELCNGCGECLAVCPTQSISLDIPEAD